MKVKVYYTIEMQKEIIEIDDKYSKLIDEDYCYDNRDEAESLYDMMIEEVKHTRLPKGATLEEIVPVPFNEGWGF